MPAQTSTSCFATTLHLLIARIEAEREDNKTDFKIESTLKPVLEKVSCAPEKDINDFVLLATPRKTKDPRKKRPLLP